MSSYAILIRICFASMLICLAIAIPESNAWLNMMFTFSDAFNIPGRNLSFIKGTRSDVSRRHEQLGDIYTRWAWQMLKKDSWKLVHLLSPPHMESSQEEPTRKWSNQEVSFNQRHY